ncbi:hypothetical protein [Peribacillus frigoritolerans]|uniref:hypothetical protein n=1 Tax=Peribacillus frigoritolerans TaxID=450367 RepID=UPI002E1A72E0|nr:hypothetical protein [Peribacillus frigoritolerans]MED3845541.1 hypothetical protein [Peribacillus frigoritolerans]
MKKLSKTEIIRYKYDTEEERDMHVKYMEHLGYECTGQVRKSDDSLMDENREYYWYGEFVQYF